MWALTHANFRYIFPPESDGSTVWLCIGPPHAQTDKELELLVRVYREGRPAVVFHAMPLGSRFRTFREEQENDEHS